MTSLKSVLKSKLTKRELSFLRSGFDTLGSIAILEIPGELVKKEKLIAKAVLQQNSAIKTVLKKVGGHSGIYRRQKTKFMAGVRTKEAVHKENGLSMKLDVEKCFFSPRLSTERMRIAQMIQPNEKVLVMFSGIAPYLLVLAKYSPAKLIVGIEKNPVAHKYALQNLLSNRIPEGKIILYNADVRKKVQQLNQKFDRIVMPLPKTADTFLGIAFRVLKKNGIIHLYQFCDESEFNAVAEKIENICKSLNKDCKIMGVFKAGQNAPHQYRVRVDIQLQN